MFRQERLMASIKGEAVDRPPVSFYELNGLDENPENSDPFNIYSHPSWKPLLNLTREKTDRIVMRGVPFKNTPEDSLKEFTEINTRIEGKSEFTTITIKAGNRILRSMSRRDMDVRTTWRLEHLLKNMDDFKTYLDLPETPPGGEPDISGILKTEELLGDTGIVMIDTSDPLCNAAELFSMQDYIMTAFSYPDMFHKLLERFFSALYFRIEAIARVLPGKLWRIYGPEFASPPYLPPSFFTEYVVKYDKPLIDLIRKSGGYPRIHCHGRIKDILGGIITTGCTGLDPIEPPPQGDVELSYVRNKYGKNLTLFGNLEVSDIENLPEPEFEKKVIKALQEGTAGEGRGFVLMPSACPYGRILSDLTLKNYEKIIEVVEKF
ncbi:MAG: hypothetical protein M1135_01405 [Candidatus Omnitrophica bacterium]|nr:hypothetical protein [Candidatus Omnitrophota bacterium]